VLTIGIDVGGTKIAAGVVDDDGHLVARRHIPTQPHDPVAVVAGITKIATEMKAVAPAAAAVGVGAAGLVDVRTGTVLGAPNIAWSNLHLRSMLEQRVKMPVIVDNDANVAGLAEATYGAGRGRGDQVMVTVGTGIGGAIVIGGKIYRGARGIGAEAGHIVIAAGGAKCPCGNLGCFEAMASGNAIGRVARERAAGPEASDARAVLERAGGSVDSITGEMVGDAAREGDAFACSVLAEVGRWLGIGLASLVNLLDPDIVVVGGGAAAGTGELLLGPARASMREHVIGHDWRAETPVAAASLGFDSGVVGAAILARELA
jgi:glucokinase